MKNVIMSLLGLALLVGIAVGAYVTIGNQKNAEELAGIEESQFVDSNGEQNDAVVASEINLSRTNGAWSVTSTGDYTIDTSTLKFEFTGYKPGGQHIGTFQNLTGSIALDAAGEAIGAVLKLDPKSIKTDTAAVDTHLQADVFFDTANHPEVTVAVKSVEEVSDTSANAITDITIKGNTKTLSIPVRIEKTATGTKFWVDTKIKISEYKMAFGPVQDDVRVVASGELKKK
jgi:polyisoprenoid-binding protein YceI